MSILDYSVPDNLPEIGQVVACGNKANVVYQKFVRTDETLFLCVDFRNDYGGVICRWYNIRKLNEIEMGVPQ